MPIEFDVNFTTSIYASHERYIPFKCRITVIENMRAAIHAVCLFALSIVVMARSSSSADLELPNSKRLAQLSAIGRATKTAAIELLQQLDSHGALAAEFSTQHLRRDFTDATEEHAYTMTPYGQVVQGIKLGLPEMDVLKPGRQQELRGQPTVSLPARAFSGVQTWHRKPVRVVSVRRH